MLAEDVAGDEAPSRADDPPSCRREETGHQTPVPTRQPRQEVTPVHLPAQWRPVLHGEPGAI